MFGFTKPSGALRTTPWRRRTPNGVYYGHAGSVWAYFEWPLSPLQWEDSNSRLTAGSKLDAAITELGDTAADIGGGMRTFALKRSIHIFSGSFDRRSDIPETTPAHAEFLSEVLPVIEPDKTLLVGVKLWPALMRNLTRGSGAGGANLLSQAKSMMSRSSDSEDSFDTFIDDYTDISEILRRNGARTPKPGSLEQLESWFNYGNGPDAQVKAASTSLHVTGGGDWQIAAVTKFTKPVLDSPGSQWLLDAMTHSDPAVAVSVRADLTPNTVIQAQLRASQRKLRAAEEEEARTGDIARDELAEKASFAKDLENNVRSSHHAWLADTSVLMAREYLEGVERNESFIDMLRTAYGIEAKPLEHRQLQALDEMQPCSSTTSNPFTQVMNPATIAYAGLPAFSNIGDPDGMWMGRVDPDYSSVFVSPFGASFNDKPPAMAIFGDPGSGKTFLAQLLAGQASLSGVQTIMINPKGFESLSSFADFVKEYDVPAQVVSMQALEREGGAFDPFRFADPVMAAEILVHHITTVIGHQAGGMSMKSEVLLSDEIKQAAMNGARCAGEALANVSDKSVVDLVMALVRGSSLFSLGFSMTPQSEFGLPGGGLTLIEFDRALPLPPPGKPTGQYEREERIAVGAMRLVTRASLEILMKAKGGVLVVDEAHHYLGSSEGLSSLQRLGREGRSLKLLPIFLTQRVSDLQQADMENYLSRIMVMKLTDPTQAAAALELCGLKPTPERISFLREAGPRRGVEGVPGRGALGFFRDLDDRHSVVMVGPVPEDVRLAFSTNPEDKERRAALRDAQQQHLNTLGTAPGREGTP